ncbi:MAG: acetate--CoA ligase [Candidatus Coatesbacteria bacterium]
MPTEDPQSAIRALLEEKRVFPPPKAFTDQANARDGAIYAEAAKDPEAFWARMAGELKWTKPWTKVLDWNPPHAQWFVGGQLNVSENCLDRHLAGWRRNKAAIIWEGEPGDERVLTYADLHREVSKFSNVLKGLGIGKGDRVNIYLPMIPEAAVAMLACTRIGAVHSVVFGGFSAESLRERINDAGAKLLITADGGWRRGKILPLKAVADEAVKDCPTITKTVVVRRVGEAAGASFDPARDVWYHEEMAKAALTCPPEPMDAEDMLYVLYTSGSTGKPKGIVHTTGGYLTHVYATTKLIFDLKEEDVFWCTADVGWVTGHSYIVYGPLANGATVLMYEGSPDFPDKDRFWRIVEKYRVTIFYTAPTAIRTFMRWGESYPAGRDLSSLRLLGTVGEPINPEAWMWYQEHIGRKKCPIVDTWWQTETGGILIAPLPGLTATKPGSATLAFPGISAEVVNDAGDPAAAGYLVLTKPWPGMLRTILNDDKRYQQTYWDRYRGVFYFTGDGAKRDEDGFFWLLGRVDDVMNVSGHRISTMEVESALVDHPAVAEAAVIGRADEMKGQAVSAFVTLKAHIQPSDELLKEIKAHVVKKIGALARPEDIFFTSELPKTRSGKIMRRLLRDVAEGRVLGDTTTLADPGVVAQLKRQYEEK